MGNNSSMVSLMFEEIRGMPISIEKKLGEKTNLKKDASSPVTSSKPKSENKTNTINPGQLIRLIAVHLQKMEQKTGQVSETIRESEKHVLSTIDELKRTVKDQKPESEVRHYHIIDLRSSRVVITIVSLSVLLLASLFGNIHLLEVNARMKDNDLKYRYIQSINGINREGLNKLEDVFYYHRDKGMIRQIREKAEDFERKLKEMSVDSQPRK